MKLRNLAKRFGAKLATGSATVGVMTSNAMAAVPTEVSTAIDTAKTDAITVGGYVLVAVAALIGIGLILRMLGLLR